MHPAANVSRIAGKLFLGLQIGLFFSGCGQEVTPPASVDNDGSTIEIPTGPKAVDLDSAHPVVLIRTNLGDLNVELDAETTPVTVDNFLEYAGDKFYDGLIFHQIDAGYMALAGAYDTKLAQREPRFPIRNEAHKAPKNTRGTLAMARDPAEIDSATSQFFINLADNANLDHTDRTPEGYGYCVFGKVTGGEEVLEKLSAAPVVDRDEFTQLPDPQIVIESIRRIR